MAPRVSRPRSDSAYWPVTALGLGLGLIAGDRLGFTVFRPSSVDAPIDEPVPEPTGAVDAGVAPRRAVAVDAGAVSAAEGPSIPVRVGGAELTGCGDGEELSIVPAQCDNPAGLEAQLRDALVRVLPRCPAAVSAARAPGTVLTLGLRTDFQRRRVAVLLGRSATVPEKVSYVACARDGLGSLGAEFWALAHAHPRYLHYFSARFGPLPPGFARDAGPAPTAPTVPEPATPAPATPTTPEPAAPAPSAPPSSGTPGPASPGPSEPPRTLPAASELQRMRALGQATVTWSAAIVRDAPRDGAIVARLPQGTAVEIVDRRGGWYAIRWGRSDNVGWTFREAIGQ